MKLPKVTLPVAGTIVTATLLATVTGAPGLPSGRDRRPAVDVSVTPGSLELTGLPCLPGTVRVGMANPGDEDVYADAFIDADRPLSVDRGVFSSYVPAGRTVTAPVEVRVPRDAAPGRREIDVDAGHGEVELPVEVVTPPGKGDGDNLLLGEQDFSSSRHGTFRACGGVDGDRSSDGWNARLTGWNDGTSRVFPDTYGAELPEPLTIGRVDVHTLDSAQFPAARFGLRDWDVQVRVGGTWQTVAQVRGNTAGRVSSTFTPVAGDAVQIVTLAANDGQYSRLIELEAYSS